LLSCSRSPSPKLCARGERVGDLERAPEDREGGLDRQVHTHAHSASTLHLHQDEASPMQTQPDRIHSVLRSMLLRATTAIRLAAVRISRPETAVCRQDLVLLAPEAGSSSSSEKAAAGGSRSALIDDARHLPARAPELFCDPLLDVAKWRTESTRNITAAAARRRTIAHLHAPRCRAQDCRPEVLHHLAATETETQVKAATPITAATRKVHSGPSRRTACYGDQHGHRQPPWVARDSDHAHQVPRRREDEAQCHRTTAAR